ncbi:hypothetical protein ACXHWJ_08465 [Alcaligenes nematophilus]
MIDVITSAITGLRVAVDMANVAIDSRDAIKIGEAKAVMISRLLDVQSACMALQEKNSALLQDKHTLANEKRDLEIQLLELQQQMNKLSNYERIRTPAGAVVYIDKETEGPNQEAVYACPNCMDQGQVSTLQPIYKGSQLHCHTHGAFGFDSEPQRGPIGMLLPIKTT